MERRRHKYVTYIGKISLIGLLITFKCDFSDSADEASATTCTARDIRSRSRSIDDSHTQELKVSHDLYGTSSSYKPFIIGNREEIISEDCFVAAVYEHIRIDNTQDMQRSINQNLEAYSNAAKIASQNGASILVAPEDGIFYGPRSRLNQWEEAIPEPNELTSENNNPCVHSSFYSECPILKKLSCIARENRIYLVANYGTKESCRTGMAYECPEDNVLQFNTDVVFGPDGNFLAKYRKVNIFIEPFDKALTVDRVVLETPFGKLGIMTCFDMMFKTPAIDLVEKDKVDTILFPTWWFDTLPELTAIQFQDAWSKATKVNLLAANIHKARMGSVGSGIYSGAGGAQIYTGANSNTSQLMLASIPKKMGKNISDKRLRVNLSRCRAGYEPRLIHVHSKDSLYDNETYRHSNSQYSEDDLIIPLNQTSDNLTRCVDGFCCSLIYSLAQDKLKVSNIEHLVLIVRNNLRTGGFRWWEQICTIATLTHPNDQGNHPKNEKSNRLKSYRFATNGLFKFERIELSANFETTYVYPVAAHNVSKLVSEEQVKVRCERQLEENQCTLTYQSDKKNVDPILVTSLYGRIYDKDKM